MAAPGEGAPVQIIDAYGDGGFRIVGKVWRGSVLLLPGEAVPWAVEDAAKITYKSLAPVRAAEPKVEILLIGCGARAVLVPAKLRERLRRDGITVDAMDTGAACRTFNVLAGEGRRVAAALIAVV